MPKTVTAKRRDPSLATKLLGKDIAGVFANEGYHTLLLKEVDGIPYVYFLLYARPFAVVRLVRESHTPILGIAGTRIALFNYRTQRHSVLTWEEWAYTMTTTPPPNF